MAEQEREGATAGEAKAPPDAPAEGEAKAERPARPERAAEAKAPAKEPPPPGGIADLIAQALPDVKLEAYQGVSNVIVEIEREPLIDPHRREISDCAFVER